MVQKKDMIMELTTRASGVLVPERYFRFASGLGKKTLDLSFKYTQLGLVEPSSRTKQRLEAEMPVNEAKIGAQFVEIAARTKAERIAKLREAVTRVGLPHDEIEVLDSMREQIDIGKKIAAKSADLPLDIVEQIEKQLVQTMEDVVKTADFPTDELDSLKKDASIMKEYGYGTIAKAILKAETRPEVPDIVTFKTVDIARRLDMQPQLLVPPDWLSEFEADRAERLLYEVPTRIT